MKIIPFEKMYYTNFHLRNLSATNRYWESQSYFSNSNFKPRMRSSLLFFRNCSVTNTYSDEEIHEIAQGSLIYYPAGLRYKTQFHNCKKDCISGQVFHFELVDENGESFIASDKAIVLNSPGKKNCELFFDEIIDILNSPNFSYSLANARILEMMYSICKSYHQELIYSKTLQPVAKGILYLEQSVSREMSIPEIAKMCHVSESTFRRLFQQYAGVGPNEFRTQKLMERAKLLFRGGGVNVAEVAELLGYEDTPHFSKLFKNHTGLTPREYIQQVKEEI